MSLDEIKKCLSECNKSTCRYVVKDWYALNKMIYSYYEDGNELDIETIKKFVDMCMNRTRYLEGNAHIKQTPIDNITNKRLLFDNYDEYISFHKHIYYSPTVILILLDEFISVYKKKSFDRFFNKCKLINKYTIKILKRFIGEKCFLQKNILNITNLYFDVDVIKYIRKYNDEDIHTFKFKRNILYYKNINESIRIIDAFKIKYTDDNLLCKKGYPYSRITKYGANKNLQIDNDDDDFTYNNSYDYLILRKGGGIYKLKQLIECCIRNGYKPTKEFVMDMIKHNRISFDIEKYVKIDQDIIDACMSKYIKHKLVPPIHYSHFKITDLFIYNCYNNCINKNWYTNQYLLNENLLQKHIKNGLPFHINSCTQNGKKELIQYFMNKYEIIPCADFFQTRANADKYHFIPQKLKDKINKIELTQEIFDQIVELDNEFIYLICEWEGLDKEEKFEIKIYIYNNKIINKLNENIKKQRELYLHKLKQSTSIKKPIIIEKPKPIEKEYNVIKLQNKLVNIESNVKRSMKKRIIQFFSLPKKLKLSYNELRDIFVEYLIRKDLIDEFNKNMIKIDNHISNVLKLQKDRYVHIFDLDKLLSLFYL